MTTDAQLPPLPEPDTVYEMWGQNMDAWGKHKIQAYARAAIAAHCAQREGEAVAWVEVRDTYEGPYEFHGQQLLSKGRHSLYLRPSPAPAAPPTEEAEQAAAYRWLMSQKMVFHWVHADYKPPYTTIRAIGDRTVPGVFASLDAAISSAMSAARTGGKP